MTPAMISACEKHLGLNVPGTTVPVFFEDQDIPTGISVYVQFFVVASDGTLPVGLGTTAKKRNVGIIQATVHGPRGNGAGVTGKVADAVWRHFTRSQLEVPGEGQITFKEGSVIGGFGKGEEAIKICRVPYSYDFQL